MAMCSAHCSGRLAVAVLKVRTAEVLSFGCVGELRWRMNDYVVRALEIGGSIDDAQRLASECDALSYRLYSRV